MKQPQNLSDFLTEFLKFLIQGIPKDLKALYDQLVSTFG